MPTNLPEDSSQETEDEERQLQDIQRRKQRRRMLREVLLRLLPELGQPEQPYYRTVGGSSGKPLAAAGELDVVKQAVKVAEAAAIRSLEKLSTAVAIASYAKFAHDMLVMNSRSSKAAAAALIEMGYDVGVCLRLRPKTSRALRGKVIVAETHVRDLAVWRCVQRVPVDSRQDFLGALGDAFGSALNIPNIYSRLLNSHKCVVDAKLAESNISTFLTNTTQGNLTHGRIVGSGPCQLQGSVRRKHHDQVGHSESASSMLPRPGGGWMVDRGGWLSSQLSLPTSHACQLQGSARRDQWNQWDHCERASWPPPKSGSSCRAELGGGLYSPTSDEEAIAHLANAGDVANASDWLELVRASGTTPSADVVRSVLRAWTRQGGSQQVQYWLQVLKEIILMPVTADSEIWR